jgi:hypothetical protein
MATRANLAEVVSGVPTSGLRAKTSVLCSASGSVPGFVSTARIQVPSPTSPTNFRRISGASASDDEVAVAASTRA